MELHLNGFVSSSIADIVFGFTAVHMHTLFVHLTDSPLKSSLCLSLASNQLRKINTGDYMNLCWYQAQFVAPNLLALDLSNTDLGMGWNHENRERFIQCLKKCY